jgi:NAD(P)-dependent dehydrogenase (short-subunit alcohol dehydrogenase family)
MHRYLFVVSRDQPELCAHLAREFSDEDGVQVVLDRRQSDRRAQRAAAAEAERRRADRRLHPSITQTLESLNFALVRGE